MKIKIKDELNKIKLTLTHRELVLLSEALNMYQEHTRHPLDYINNRLFDAQEYGSWTQIASDVNNIKQSIDNALSTIKVY